MIDSLLLQQAGTCTRKLCTRSKGPERQGVVLIPQCDITHKVAACSSLLYGDILQKCKKQQTNKKLQGHGTLLQLPIVLISPSSSLTPSPRFFFFFKKKLEATFCSNFFVKAKVIYLGLFYLFLFFFTLTYYIVYFTDQRTLNELLKEKRNA